MKILIRKFRIIHFIVGIFSLLILLPQSLSAGDTNYYRVLAGGNYNGDLYDDIAIFRPSSGLWSVREITRVYFGDSSDNPAPGDYDGDGTTDICIFRSAGPG